MLSKKHSVTSFFLEIRNVEEKNVILLQCLSAYVGQLQYSSTSKSNFRSSNFDTRTFECIMICTHFPPGGMSMSQPRYLKLCRVPSVLFKWQYEMNQYSEISHECSRPSWS